jgi:cation diffusion facilitator CzcD-associated flavoprotein CzcO
MVHAAIAIIGGGFGGICAAIKLIESGCDDLLIFEKAGSFGGTWRDNTYPGCACDIPSHLYSFSFAQDAGWTRTFAPQPEILAYIHRVASRYGLEGKTAFNTAITAATWSETENRWHLVAADGRRFTARVVIAATGLLHVPQTPALPGLETFVGPTFHSARWRHDIDLTGKRVAVIGTGASAIQFVPQIAPQVAGLDLYQRSPPWVLPRHDRSLSTWMRGMMARLPLVQRIWRAVQYWDFESIAIGFTMFPRLLDHWQRQAEAFIRRSIKDDALAARLVPAYRMGCKRVLLSDDYYPALARGNVTLVTAGIREVRARGIVTADGVERPTDVIIFGTGFKPMDITATMQVAGRGGRLLAEEWRHGPQAFYGVAVAGYPNFFMLMGPNSALGHNSIIFMIEAQVRYILQCLAWLDEDDPDGHPVASIEVRADVQRDFNAALQRKFDGSVWAGGGPEPASSCTSWYVHDSGRNHVLWPGFSASYWWALRKPERGHFLPETAT